MKSKDIEHFFYLYAVIIILTFLVINTWFYEQDLYESTSYILVALFIPTFFLGTLITIILYNLFIKK